jgi:hypothetical protein
VAHHIFRWDDTQLYGPAQESTSHKKPIRTNASSGKVSAQLFQKLRSLYEHTYRSGDEIPLDSDKGKMMTTNDTTSRHAGKVHSHTELR